MTGRPVDAGRGCGRVSVRTTRALDSRALLAGLWQPPFRGAVVDVVLRIDLAHRGLAQPFLVGMGDEPWHPRDDEERVAELVVEPQVPADRGNRAVDVQRHGLAVRPGPRLEQTLDHAHQPDVV